MKCGTWASWPLARPDFALYCERNLVERFFNKLKPFRAIATRYDKLARNFLAGIQLACAIILPALSFS
jgi:transposase